MGIRYLYSIFNLDINNRYLWTDVLIKKSVLKRGMK